ncbi:MAG: hypothetical protein EB164_09120 [Thaumarchaeota archaeon]|nr:hypothetical protein [Nitrososphaerota archaeon]
MIKMRKTIFLLAIISASVVSLSGVDQAFAHQRVDIPTTHQSTNIRLTVGHSNEPAYGASRTHDGLHGFEMSIVDKDTKLPVSGTGTSLKLDKYYFKNVEKYNKATSSNQADKIDKNIQFGSVFGSPGTYLHRQIVDTGVYGYRIYGTVSYYGVKTIPVDVKQNLRLVRGLARLVVQQTWTTSHSQTNRLTNKDPDDLFSFYFV